MAKKDEFTRDWIIENSLEIIQRYTPGMLTLRALYYQLVTIGMTNSLQHYGRVKSAMIVARKDGRISYDTFSDRGRAMVGETKWLPTDLDEQIEEAKESIQIWMNYYRKNRWENQNYYIEVFIEKQALEGVFQRPCFELDIALGSCKGYPSLTFLYETAIRIRKAIDYGKEPVILYFGDYDPSGEDIPRSIRENMIGEFGCDVEIRRVALMEDQVIEWNLPPAPTKMTDSRSGNWGGLGQVELDAVRPEKLQNMLRDAVSELFDEDLYSMLKQEEKEEKEEYQIALREHVSNL